MGRSLTGSFHRKFLGSITLSLCVGLMLALFMPQRTFADDPVCPPGFVWDRLSGVGCVQENCWSVTHAKLSYTGACICDDGYQGCIAPIDLTGFDPSGCAPFCPSYQLTSCVAANATCPQVDQTTGPDPLDDASGQTTLPLPDLSDWGLDGSALLTLDAWMQELLTGGPYMRPSRGRIAAGAVIAGVLFSSWSLVNWAGNQDLFSSLMERIREWGSSLLDAFKPKEIERSMYRSAGEHLAEESINIIEALDKKPEKPPAPPTSKPQPVKAPASAGVGAAPAASTDPLVPKPQSVKPVKGKIDDLKSRVFSNTEAMEILKALNKLPKDAAVGSTVPVTRNDLDGYLGPHTDGKPREITLSNGRRMIVTKVEAIGFEGDGKAGAGGDPGDVTLDDKVQITVEMTDLDSVPAAPKPGKTGAAGPGQPTKGGGPTPSSGKPAAGQSPAKPSSTSSQTGTGPPDSKAAGEGADDPAKGAGESGDARPEGSTGEGTGEGQRDPSQPQSSAPQGDPSDQGGGEGPGSGDSSGDEDVDRIAEEFLSGDSASGGQGTDPSGSSTSQGQSTTAPSEPDTGSGGSGTDQAGESYEGEDAPIDESDLPPMDDETLELIEEARRLLRDWPEDPPEIDPPEPSEPGQGDIIDGESETATDDF